MGGSQFKADGARLVLTSRIQAQQAARIPRALTENVGCGTSSTKTAAMAEGKAEPDAATLRIAAEHYVPAPVDTESVKLPKEVAELTEVLAKNAHDEWAKQRFSDGWMWGAKRDDELKHHPCLVPYEDLTDTEREYDRITAMKTLKLLIGLGFSIERDETSKGSK